MTEFATQVFAARHGLVAIDIDQVRESLPKVKPDTKHCTYTAWPDKGAWCVRYFLDDCSAEYAECLVFETPE
jgi:hypothetical protein